MNNIGSARTIPLRRASRENIAIAMTLIVLSTVTVYTMLNIDTGGVQLFPSLKNFLKSINEMLLKPESSHLTFAGALYSIIVTLGLGFLTTIIGAMVAFVFGIFAARNLTNTTVSNAIKIFVSLIRAIPTIFWVLIFAIGAGLGSVAAVTGMTFHSVGYLIKAYSEAFEEIDSGTIDALKAGGATWLQIIFQAVIPSTTSALLSWTFIRFEINFTTSVAMGAAAAAGGIGFDLYQASSFYFNINEVGFITYLILSISVMLEITASKLKR